MEKTITSKKVFGNSMWQIGEKIVSMLFSIIITSIIARYLGVENYGLVNYIISIVMLFTAFSTLGMEKITIKDILEKQETEEKILGTCFYIRIIGGIVLIALSQIVIYILNGNDILSQTIGIIMGIRMLFRAFEVIEYYLQSQMKIKTISIIKFTATITTGILRILVVVYDLGLVGFAMTYLVDSIVVAFLLYTWYKRNIKIRIKFDKQYAKKILSRCWYIAISGVMVTLYMKVDQIMLGTMLNSTTENGIYSAATRIAGIWYFIPMSIISSVQPMIVQKKKYGEKQYESAIQKLYDIIAFIGLFFCIVITIFGETAVSILYGEEYYAAVEVLQISVWAGLFATLGTARSVWLINQNLQKYTLVYTSIGCITNIVLNYYLISTMGAKGAAIATLIAQFVANIVALVPFRKTRKSSIMILKSLFFNKTLIDILTNYKNIISKNRFVS